MSNPPPPTSPEREERVQALFTDAIALPTDQVRAFLDQACGGDAALRDDLEALLAAHRDAGAFLSGPAATLDDAGADDLIGTRVGRYAITATLGEGGFGTVYRARQDAPIRRDVALKVIKLGMDTRQVIARFDAERQALAILDHPGIAKVFDAGTTENGRPYFVMELVDGVPITAYCDRENLSARQRLELFVPVCRALQHAHQKGIIHRDIKPNNVLVAVQDGAAVPKIIDFGIAKATQAKLTERTLFTEARQLVGTPAYMSPEQAGGEGGDVDTRSDVYSMGVLLYELLTGTTPIEERSLRSAAYDQMQRMIREFEPPPPSARVTTLGATAASVAAVRTVEPKALSRAIRGEVDWIVMRCLEKARARRYQSAEALGDDIQRQLNGDDVLARPATRAYLARKFARRHVVGISVAGLFLAVLIGALVVSTVALARENRARALADRANVDTLGAIKASIGWYGTNHPTPLLRGYYESMRTAYGVDNAITIAAANMLCHALEQDGYRDEEERLAGENVERARRVCGPHSNQYLGAVQHVITGFTGVYRYEESLPANKMMFELIDSDEVDPHVAGYYCQWWGNTLTIMQRYAEAKQPLLGALRILRTRTPESHGSMKEVLYQLAEGADVLGEPTQAVQFRREAYAEAQADARRAVPPAGKP